MFSRGFLLAKRGLRLKCSQCKELLPAAHFPHHHGTPMHSLVCVHCKRLCVVCGVRQSLDRFADGASDVCQRCVATEAVAEGNVFFRFPVLKYRACPFSVDEMRDSLQRERRGEGEDRRGTHRDDLP